MPFIARYRKEVTGSLDDAQLRDLDRTAGLPAGTRGPPGGGPGVDRRAGQADRRAGRPIAAAETKARLEDIYLPFKPKRRTKAQIAREAGLEPLADLLIGDPSRDPNAAAAGFVDAEQGRGRRRAALAGARAILAERFGEDADLVGELRELLWQRGRLVSAVPATRRPSRCRQVRRLLRLLRAAEIHAVAPHPGDVPGRDAGRADAHRRPRAGPARPDCPDRALATTSAGSPAASGIADRGRPADRWLLDTVRWAWRTRIAGLAGHRRADPAAAVRRAGRRRGVRRQPQGPAAGRAGRRPRRPWASTPASGPGSRWRWSTAPARWWPPTPSTRTSRRTDGTHSLVTLQRLVAAHGVELVAIGNGTASRETDRLARRSRQARAPG